MKVIALNTIMSSGKIINPGDVFDCDKKTLVHLLNVEAVSPVEEPEKEKIGL